MTCSVETEALIWKSICKELSKMREDNIFCDVTILVKDLQGNDKTIQAHSVILSACSQLFSNALKGPSDSDTHKHIEIIDLDYDTVMTVINFIYGDRINSTKDVLTLQKAATYFNVSIASFYLESNIKPRQKNESGKENTIVKEEVKDEQLTKELYYCNENNYIINCINNINSKDITNNSDLNVVDIIHDVPCESTIEKEDCIKTEIIHENIAEISPLNDKVECETYVTTEPDLDNAENQNIMLVDKYDVPDKGLDPSDEVIIDIGDHAPSDVLKMDFKREQLNDPDKIYNDKQDVDIYDNIMGHQIVTIAEEVEWGDILTDTDQIEIIKDDTPAQKKYITWSKSNNLCCLFCGKDHQSMPSLVQHLQKHHSDSPFYVCSLCHRTLRFQKAIVKHYKIAHGIESSYVILQHCHGFINHLNATNHPLLRKESHQYRKYDCPHCLSRFASITELETHMHDVILAKKPELDLNSSRYECFKCGDIYSSYSFLAKHIDTRHKFRHQCHICSMVCTTKANLKLHTMTHTGDKNFVCDLCGKSFRQAHHLQDHKLTHSNVKNFNCPYCSKIYRFSQALRRHIRLSHDESFVRSFQCTQCDYVAAMKQNLDIHMRKHTGVKPYVCQLCKKAFSQANHLKRHFVSHVRKGEMTVDGEIMESAEDNELLSCDT